MDNSDVNDTYVKKKYKPIKPKTSVGVPIPYLLQDYAGSTWAFVPSLPGTQVQALVGNVSPNVPFLTQSTSLPTLPTFQASANKDTETELYDEESNLTMEDVEKFAKEFKRKRVNLGFTQNEVGVALGNCYGNIFSQTTVCRFEAMQLSFKNMCKLYPLMHKWLEEIDNSLEVTFCPISNLPLKRRKKRTTIDYFARKALEERFLKCQRPTAEDAASIANELNLEKDVVLVWFRNRRQKERKNITEGIYVDTTSITITVPETSITEQHVDLDFHTMAGSLELEESNELSSEQSEESNKPQLSSLNMDFLTTTEPDKADVFLPAQLPESELVSCSKPHDEVLLTSDDVFSSAEETYFIEPNSILNSIDYSLSHHIDVG